LVEPPVLVTNAFVATPHAVFGPGDAEVEGELLAGHGLLARRRRLSGTAAAAEVAV
jgi:hypothetical protein